MNDIDYPNYTLDRTLNKGPTFLFIYFNDPAPLQRFAASTRK